MIDRIQPEQEGPDNLMALAEALVDAHGASLRSVMTFSAGIVAFVESKGLLKELHAFILELDELDEIDPEDRFNKAMLEKMLRREHEKLPPA